MGDALASSSLTMLSDQTSFELFNSDPELQSNAMSMLLSEWVAGFEAEITARDCDGWVAHVHSFNGASRGLMQRAGAVRAVEVYEKRLG